MQEMPSKIVPQTVSAVATTTSADPFAFSAERRGSLAAAKQQAEGYDIYHDFPQLPNLAKREHAPTSILVTGAAGFIASHVAIRLVRLYPHYRVVGVDKVSYCSDEKNIVEPLKACKNFRFVKADICNYKLMLEIMQEEKVDTVMHLAAQSHVDLSFKDGGPQQFAIDNVLGTASLLEAARKAGVKRFVHCSTDEVYGEGGFGDQRVIFDENAELKPNNPYSASKAGADLLAQSFAKSFNFPVVITRGNNVYGPHQFYEKVVPKFIAQLKLGRQLTIHGSGSNTRNFLHVQDTASAFDAILHCGKDGEAYNIGGKNEKSVLDVAADLLLLLGLESKKDELVSYVVDRAHNDACYPISNGKLCELGWQEQHSWEFGLANTAVFFLAKLQSEGRDIGKVLDPHPGHSASDAANGTAPHSRL
jgi:UDP-glucose 4,6-dehydratase